MDILSQESDGAFSGSGAEQGTSDMEEGGVKAAAVAHLGTADDNEEKEDRVAKCDDDDETVAESSPDNVVGKESSEVGVEGDGGRENAGNGSDSSSHATSSKLGDNLDDVESDQGGAKGEEEEEEEDGAGDNGEDKKEVAGSKKDSDREEEESTRKEEETKSDSGSKLVESGDQAASIHSGTKEGDEVESFTADGKKSRAAEELKVGQDNEENDHDNST